MRGPVRSQSCVGLSPSNLPPLSGELGIHKGKFRGGASASSSRVPSWTKVILLCGKSDAMPPDEFWTELCDSLTAFYDNILKKSGAGGRPAAKNLSCKVVTQTTSVPNPPVVPCQYPLTTPTPTASSPCRRCRCLHRRRPLRRDLPRPPKY